MSKTHVQAFVDRIEGEVAVLLVGDEGRPLNLPVTYLPIDVEEGTVVNLEFEVDREATLNAKRRTDGLIKRLQRRKH